MRRRSEIVFLYACSTFVALLLSAIIVEAVGANWADVWNALLDGSLRKPGRWGKTLGSPRLEQSAWFNRLGPGPVY